MITLKNNRLEFDFSDVHPEAHCFIEFQRTLRIPDDQRDYPLPAGLGRFPLRHLDDYAKRLPENWRRRGGVMAPMHQAEALWINFQSSYPFAVKVATGKVCAITGDSWVNHLNRDPQDYVVLPEQRWLDGYCEEEGVIRQFVAMPLGEGYTVEEQLTGAADHGGLQISVYPMKRKRHQPQWVRDEVQKLTQEAARLKREARRLEAQARKLKQADEVCLQRYIKERRREAVHKLEQADEVLQRYIEERRLELERWDPKALASIGMPEDPTDPPISKMVAPDDMGLAPGGRMKQQIFDDTQGLDKWDQRHGSRCFVSLLNSEQWMEVTGEQPPDKPLTKEAYHEHRLPWFEYYDEDAPAVAGSAKLKGSASVAQQAQAKGQGPLENNETIEVQAVVSLGDGRPVRECVDAGASG